MGMESLGNHQEFLIPNSLLPSSRQVAMLAPHNAPDASALAAGAGPRSNGEAHPLCRQAAQPHCCPSFPIEEEGGG